MSTATKKAQAKQSRARPVELTVDGQVREGGMFLRTGYADGEVEHDGKTWKIEYAVSTGGSVLVTLSREGIDGWTTYLMSPEGIMRAACNLHFAKAPE